jgi:hypothetical protein
VRFDIVRPQPGCCKMATLNPFGVCCVIWLAFFFPFLSCLPCLLPGFHIDRVQIPVYGDPSTLPLATAVPASAVGVAVVQQAPGGYPPVAPAGYPGHPQQQPAVGQPLPSYPMYGAPGGPPAGNAPLGGTAAPPVAAITTGGTAKKPEVPATLVPAAAAAPPAGLDSPVKDKDEKKIELV